MEYKAGVRTEEEVLKETKILIPEKMAIVNNVEAWLQQSKP
jgi:hypothetical protein